MKGPLHCGCPPEQAWTAHGPYRGPSDEDPTPEDEPVFCKRCSGSFKAPVGTGRRLSRRLIKALTEGAP